MLNVRIMLLWCGCRYVGCMFGFFILFVFGWVNVFENGFVDLVVGIFRCG